MTTKSQTAIPIAAADRRMIELLLLGAKQRVVIPAVNGDYRRLFRMKARLNEIRNALRREKIPEWEIAFRCVIGLEPINSKVPTHLILHPRDAEFDSLLSQISSIAAEELSPTALADLDKLASTFAEGLNGGEGEKGDI